MLLSAASELQSIRRNHPRSAMLCSAMSTDLQSCSQPVISAQDVTLLLRFLSCSYLTCLSFMGTRRQFQRS